MKATVAVLCAIACATAANSEGGFIWKEKAKVENGEGKSELNADEFEELIKKIKATAQTYLAENEETFPEGFKGYKEFYDSANELIPADKSLNYKQRVEVNQAIAQPFTHKANATLIEKIIKKAFDEFFPDGIQPQEEKKITDFKNKVEGEVKQQIQESRATHPITLEREQEIMQQAKQLVEKKIETKTAQGGKGRFREADVKEHGKMPSHLVVSS